MKLLSFIFLIIFASLTASGQSVEIKSFVDKNNVSTNEVISFTISTNSNCQIYTPDFDGLVIIQGPFKSSSQKIVTINGQRSIEQQLQYTYRLRAPKEGSFTIKPVRMVCDDKEYKTESITISANATGSTNGQASNINTNSDFFLRMYANKTNVYEGEPFTVTLKVFSKSQPENIENLELGDSKGLLRKDLNPKQTRLNFDLEIINGIRYLTTTIRSELCFAQNSGKIDIEPAYISAIFRRGFFQQYRREATSNKLSINVKPLPRNAPANFNGLVGKIDLKYNVSKNSVKPGEAVDFQVEISGSGNLNTFDDPVFNFPSSFEQFDPEMNEKLSYKSKGISGSIEYNYVLIPTYHGNYSIPPYAFSYFDIETQTYRTLATDTIQINVEQTATSTAAGADFKNSQKEIEVEATDIRHLMPYDDVNYIGSGFLVNNFLFYALLLTPPLIIWVLFWWRKRKQSDEYQASYAVKTSYDQAKKQLEEARTLAKNNSNEEALKTASGALKTFLKQKNNLSTLNLNLQYLEEFYDSKGWQNDFTQLKAVWQKIDMHQYAPIPAEQLDKLVSEVDLLIDKIAAHK